MKRIILLLACLAAFAVSAAAQTETFEALVNRSYDHSAKALRVNMSATPSGTPNPATYLVDQIFNWSFDRTNQALRVECVSGCAAEATFPRLDQVLDPTAGKTFAMGGKTLTFGGVTQIAAGPQSGFTSDADYYQSIATHNFTTLNTTNAAQASNGEGTGLTVVHESNDANILVDGIVAVSKANAAGNQSTVGIQGFGYLDAAISGGQAEGVFGEGRNLGGAASSLAGVIGVAIMDGGTTTSAKAFQSSVYQKAGASQDAFGFYISSTIKLAGTMDNFHGLYIEDQTVARTNHTIETGLSPFGGNILGDRLTVKSNAAAIQPVTFTGAGLDDATSGGTYTGLNDLAYCVQIDASAPSPDTFEWGTGGSCSNGATGVGITGAAQNLSNGVQITFAAIDGHTIGDDWTFTAYAPIPLTLQDHNGNVTFKVRETGTVVVGSSVGVTDSGSSCTITAITGGIITGATCTP